MKKIILLSFTFLLTAAGTCFAQVHTPLDLLGIWKGNQVRVEFMDNNNVSVVFTGNKKQTGRYKADFLLSPATLEMSFMDGDKPLEFKCLVEFTDNNTLKWETFSMSANPRYFTRGFALLSRAKN